ncbi:extracellular solute-binding protein [Paenibacillus sp. GYB004]|uniref:extracellular solute-binding protein n=1 Tax=Paenibacillus sp. GYB004 TaxID=2994393 RepID=UPI002F96DB33
MRNRPTNEQFLQQLRDMVDGLRESIRGGAFPDGEYLPSEKELAAKFGLSNNSVRKGLEQLVEEGWIEKVPRVGNRVRANSVERRPVTLTLNCNQASFRNLELAALLDDFHRRHPWITVKTKAYGGTLEDEHGDGEAADLIMLDNYQFQRIAEEGRALYFKALPSKEGIYPALSKLFVFEEACRMQPIIFSPIVLCYNKAHFRECGLEEPDGSWTWDDLMGCAERLSNGKGRYGFGAHVQDMNRWPIFLLQSGERFERENGRLKDLRGSRLLQSMRIAKSLIHNRKASPLFLSESNNDTIKLFMEGKLSMILNSYMGLNVWKQSDLDYDLSPVPFIHEPRTLMICLGLGVNARSGHMKEAMLLADYLGSSRASRLIASRTLSIPALRPLPALAADSSIRRPERYGLYRDILFSCRTHGDLNIPLSAFPAIFQPLKEYWADMIGEDELCERIGSVLADNEAETVVADGVD